MSGGRQVIAFRVGPQLYGVPIEALHEIVRLPPLTPVPEGAPGIEGLMNLRGRVVAVLDVRRRLGLPPVARSPRTRVLVVGVEGHRLGLLVDEASEVLRIPDGATEPAPAEALTGEARLAAGVGRAGDRLVVLLDLDRLAEPARATAPVAPAAAGPAAGA